MFTNKHGENLLDEDLENLDDDYLSYATEVGPDEIPGVDSDLSEVSDDDDLLNPKAEVQQTIDGLQGNAEMEIIQEDDKVEEAVDDEVIESEKTITPRTLFPQKPASRVSNFESVTSSPLVRSTPEPVESGKYCNRFSMPEETTTRYPTKKREAVKWLAMEHGGKSFDEYTLTQMSCMSMIAEKYAPKRLSLNRGMRVWGVRGMSSVKGELSHIHHRNVFRPADSHGLTWK